MRRPVIKVARKGKNLESKKIKEETLNSTKNHLKVYQKYTLVLDEYSSG